MNRLRIVCAGPAARRGFSFWECDYVIGFQPYADEIADWVVVMAGYQWQNTGTAGEPERI